MFKVHVSLRQGFSDDCDDGSWVTSNARGVVCGFGMESTCVGSTVTHDDHDG